MEDVIINSVIGSKRNRFFLKFLCMALVLMPLLNCYGQVALPVTASFSSVTSSSSAGSMPDGFSQSGLAGYNGALKFDTQGDYLLLYFSVSPGTLSFDLGVNNTFPGTIPATATFTIQQSSDGTNFSDIGTYSNVAGGTKTLTNLSNSARYVKWIYTTKPSNTNISLKNISLSADPSTPVFSPVGNIYTSPQSVNLTSGISGAKIYYTTDGTEPNNLSTLYTSAIAISTNTTIKAIVYDINNENPGNVVSTTYTIITPSYFRSKATGNWSSSGTWESSTNNVDWVNATRVPSYLDYTTTISNGTTVTVDVATTVDEVVIANGGVLYTGPNGSSNLTVNDGTSADDITIQDGGKMIYTGLPVYSGSAKIRINSGGILSVQGSGLTANGSGVNATNHIYDNNSILEWNAATATPSASGVTYFPNVDNVTIPVLRFSANVGSFGGVNPTVVNGKVEIMDGISLTLASAGLKTFRNGLVLNSSSTLTLNAGVKLTVNDLLTNNGTIKLLSDATNGTATILTPSGIGGSGTASVSQILTGGRNWYMSSPVTGATGAAVLASSTATTKPAYCAGYDETQGSAAGWTTENSTLVPGKGYVFVSDPSTPSTDGTITFSGTLTAGTKNIDLTYTASADKAGFNLVGNPFPAYLNIASLASNTNVEPSYWFRTYKTGTGYIFDSENLPSGLSVGPSGWKMTGKVPPLQAFWVLAKNASTLSFSNSDCVHQDDATNKFRVASADDAQAQQVLRLEVSNGINEDETILYSNVNAMNGLDIYDTQKMSNSNSAIPEIFTIADNKYLVINGLNAIKSGVEYPIGFSAGQNNTYSIKAKEVTHLDNFRIILEDKALGTETDLTDGAEYVFSSAAITTADRFSVVFRSVSVTTEINRPSQSNMSIGVNEQNQIVVSLDNNQTTGTACVYNITGQKLAEFGVKGTGVVLNTNLHKGIYLVKVNDGMATQTREIVLR